MGYLEGCIGVEKVAQGRCKRLWIFLSRYGLQVGAYYDYDYEGGGEVYSLAYYFQIFF